MMKTAVARSTSTLQSICKADKLSTGALTAKSRLLHLHLMHEMGQSPYLPKRSSALTATEDRGPTVELETQGTQDTNQAVPKDLRIEVINHGTHPPKECLLESVPLHSQRDEQGAADEKCGGAKSGSSPSVPEVQFSIIALEPPCFSALFPTAQKWSDACASSRESAWPTGMLTVAKFVKKPGVSQISNVRAFSYCLPRLRVRQHLISEGVVTNLLDDATATDIPSRSPFYFETGYSIFAKRLSRPFPPPFLSRPSGSFSDPLTTHSRSRDRRPSVNGEIIKGITNGDDAIIIGGHNFLGVNDGVGAWAQKDRGHAALWSRLIAHFWAVEVEHAFAAKDDIALNDIHLITYLQSAFNQTKEVVSKPNEVLGTTTVSSALLHHRSENEPVVLATIIGDCAVLVIRPSNEELIYETQEQWHWFDCPRQLGTNSPDTPEVNAVMDIVDIKENDVVVVVSDGVTDNLWKHEICTKVSEAVKKWQNGDKDAEDGMVYVARELMKSAKEIAEDPYAESPYMERALDEGIAAEGGKLDDISVIVGICKKRQS